MNNQKKRLMFIKGEDYNYITYNLLLILETLGCNSIEQAFLDYRKLPFIIMIISDKKYLNLLNRYMGKLSPKGDIEMSDFDKEVLIRLYYDGISVSRQLNQLISILSKKDLIGIDKKGLLHSIYLKEDPILNDFLNGKVFQYEVQNIESLKKQINRLRSTLYDTFMDKIFYNFGIIKCDF